MARGAHEGDDSRYPTSLIRVAESDIRPKYRGRLAGMKHPTQKPIELIEWLILTYTNPGGLVLDPMFGSGTTPHACARTKRRFVGCEMHRPYFDNAVDRVRSFLKTEKKV
ncbi:MAG: site-specific DNA-methyltransferase [Cytophagaceae bacterium]|nr:MAG: site-specific DNA-methyltransferase [Cytophagaceae bacterium]